MECVHEYFRFVLCCVVVLFRCVLYRKFHCTSNIKSHPKQSSIDTQFFFRFVLMLDWLMLLHISLKEVETLSELSS